MSSGRNRKSGRKTPPAHKEMSEKVRLWAISNELWEHQRIDELIQDLENQNNYAYWSSQRPSELLPQKFDSATDNAESWYQRVLFLRNLLVFLPVTITWIAISEASSSFSEFTTENSGSIVNFLQFWQDGYGYLASIWRLSSIALIDFFILATIMFLTSILPIFKARIARQQERFDRKNADARDALCKELFEFFVNNQIVAPLNFDRKLAKSLRDLSKSTQNLEKVTKELAKTSKNLPSQKMILRDLKIVEKNLERLAGSD